MNVEYHFTGSCGALLLSFFLCACTGRVVIDLNDPGYDTNNDNGGDTESTSMPGGTARDSNTVRPEDTQTQTESSGGTDMTTDEPFDTASLTPPPLCEFAWGLRWREDGVGFPGNLDFMSVWVGYEDDGAGLNGSIVRLLAEVQDVRSPLRDVLPLYYAYFIKFKAESQGGLVGCDGFLCREGARWIRANRDYLLGVYDEYARLTALELSPGYPMIWLIEPGLSEYSLAESQYDPLSLDELGRLASDIIDVVRARMPNAFMALFHTPSYPDARTYWSHFDLSKVDLIVTTGMGDNNGYFNTWDNQGVPDGTYRYLHQVTGKSILVDTGFDYTQLEDTWSTASPQVINQRIGDGVFAVHIEPVEDNQSGIDAVADNIDRLAPDLSATCP